MTVQCKIYAHKNSKNLFLTEIVSRYIDLLKHNPQYMYGKLSHQEQSRLSHIKYKNVLFDDKKYTGSFTARVEDRPWCKA